MTAADRSRGKKNFRGYFSRKNLLVLGIMALVVLLVALILGAAAWTQQNRQEPALRYVEGAFDAISVKGRTGATPVVVVDHPVSIATLKSERAVVGTGREILADSPVLLGIYSFSAENGASLSASALPQLVTGLATEDNLGAELANLVIGQTEGTRLLLLRPLSDGGTEIDVVDVLPLVANGSPVEDSDGPLTVEMTDAGPLISHGKEAPTSDSVQLLLQGTGGQVHSGDTVVLQYLSQRWTDGSVVSSTWGEGIPEAIEIDQAMIGLQNALIDRTIGSRLALTIPADEANGEDTLVMVVDILGTEPSE